MGPSLSVIVTTYNFPEALAICLKSLNRQIDRDFEIIVADDGSSQPTHAVIDAARRDCAVPIHNVTQENTGFRAARIRNVGLRQSRADYVVFIDGDCFVLPDFVANHRGLATPGKFVSGKRSYLRTRITRRTIHAMAPPPGGRFRWLARAIVHANRPAEFIYSRPDASWRDTKPDDWRLVQTCNLGAWRSDLVRINGFDNRYTGYGLEDSDLAVRLMRSGIRRKMGDHASLVLHLEHERRPRPPGSPNAALFAATLERLSCRTEDGLAEV